MASDLADGATALLLVAAPLATELAECSVALKYPENIYIEIPNGEEPFVTMFYFTNKHRKN